MIDFVLYDYIMYVFRLIVLHNWVFAFFIILQVDECLDNFNYELAVKFCERALCIEPDNMEVLEMAGSVYLETGDMDKAKSVSLRLWPLKGTIVCSIYFFLTVSPLNHT